MNRTGVRTFRDIPNVGPATEKLFFALGLETPAELAGKDPYRLYRDVCRINDERYDPCVIDVLISAVRYMEGGPPRKWWEFTAERKQYLSRPQ
jgi:hypothetical protein